MTNRFGDHPIIVPLLPLPSPPTNPTALQLPYSAPASHLIPSLPISPKHTSPISMSKDLPQKSPQVTRTENLEQHFKTLSLSVFLSLSLYPTMKKLYRKSTVHPTTSVVSDQLLSFLPAAILALTAALSAGDKEVLAYLIYCSSASSNRKTTTMTTARKAGEDHAPCFNCNCFRCYMSYWVRWDSSPNRQLIHEIIDAFEDSLLKDDKKEKGKRDRKGKGKSVRGGSNITSSETKKSEAISSGLATKEDVSSSHEADVAAEDCGETSGGGCGGVDVEEDYEEEVEGGEKGSVRRFVSFLGERIWSVWG